jgi:proline iminopeptidase
MNPKPFNTGYLPEKDGHQIYFAQYGNPKGEVIITLHGGPGSKSKPKYAGVYNLKKYRVITFDQRGCGNSLPAGEISHNTLQDLVADMERLRSKLKIKQWFVAGGSWGSTLALAYAEEHPKNVKGLLLSSIFLARPQDEEWSFTKSGGIERLFPDLWEKRLKFLEKYQATPSSAAKILLEAIQSQNSKTVAEIVAEVDNWEGNLMTAQEGLNFTDPEEVDDKNIASTKIFLHYEANNFFLKPNQLLKNINKIKSIPAIIIHGRYDILCPVKQAWEVKKNLPKSEIVILPTSNHDLTADGEVARKLAFDRFLSQTFYKN